VDRSRKDIRSLSAEWLAAEARLVVLTRRQRGGDALLSRWQRIAPAIAVKVADTVEPATQPWADCSRRHDRRALSASVGATKRTGTRRRPRFALAVAAVTCSRVGADPPTRAELVAFLA